MSLCVLRCRTCSSRFPAEVGKVLVSTAENQYMDTIAEVPQIIYEESIIEIPQIECRMVVTWVSHADIGYMDETPPKMVIKYVGKVAPAPQRM